MKFVPLVLLLLFPCFVSAQNAEAAEVDPYEWVVETYRFPDSRLVGGFTSEERGAMTVPRLPNANAKPAQWQEFIRKNSSVVTHYMELGGLSLPKGALLVFDPESETLVARLPRISQSSVAFSSDALVSNASRYLAFEYTIYEAPAGKVRRLVDGHATRADRTEMAEALEAMVEGGEAKVVAVGNVETRSGQRTQVWAGKEEGIPIDLVLEGGGITHDTEVRDVGTILEMDPVIGSDGTTIDLNISLEHHYGEPAAEEVPIVQVGGKALSAAPVQFQRAEVTTALTTKDGMTALLGVWNPRKGGAKAATGILQVGFVRSQIVEVLPLPNSGLADVLRKHGDAVAPIPKGELAYKKKAEEVPEGMVVRQFRIPPDFIDSSGGRDSVVDPFAPDSEPRFTIRATVKDILMARGIQFPEGASANFMAANGLLIVRNTPENIALIEAYVMDMRNRVSRTMGYLFEVVEGPREVMRDAARELQRLPDHAAVLEELRKQKGVQILEKWVD